MALEFSRGQPVRKWEAELWAAWSLCSDLWESLWGPPQPPHPCWIFASFLPDLQSGDSFCPWTHPPTPSSAVATSRAAAAVGGYGGWAVGVGTFLSWPSLGVQADPSPSD